MPRYARLLVVLSALLLLAVYVFPLWRIGLLAPQYPEGLGMRIHIDNVTGATEHDLKNINNLNHYIGMKAIEPDAIPELRYMPWIVAGLIASAIGVAIAGRRTPLYVWTGAFATICVAGLVDFWLWQYDYGHNLDEAAAIIKIPGMTYQPPLIGTKQLLNFTATSLPDVGGIAIGLSMLCAVAAVVLTIRAARSRSRAAVAGVALVAIACASADPRAIRYGEEECGYCRMVVSDERYGAQAVTATGKVHVFDSVECLASFVLAQEPGALRSLWVTDFAARGTLVAASEALFVRADTQRSPMGLGLTAFAPHAPSSGVAITLGGQQLGWEEVLELVRTESPSRSSNVRGAGVTHGHSGIGADASVG